MGSIADENPTIRCASLIYNNVLHERHFCLNSRCRVAPKPKGLISHGVLQQDLTSQQGRCLRLPVLHTKTFAGFCQQTQSMRMFFCSPSRLRRQVVTPLAAMEQAIYSVSRLEQQFVDPHIWAERGICQWQNYVNYKVASMGVIMFMWFRIPS